MVATLLGYILEQGDGVNSPTLGRGKRREMKTKGLFSASRRLCGKGGIFSGLRWLGLERVAPWASELHTREIRKSAEGPRDPDKFMKKMALADDREDSDDRDNK
jgi:hypothetical protein